MSGPSGGSGFRLGIVGCGRVAERAYVPAIAILGAVRLVAAADPTPDRRELLGGLAAGARTYGTAEEMIAAGGLDGVVIASPPAHHLAAAELAAAAGLPALVEKPPADSAAAARRMAALSPTPAVGFNRRFGLGRGLATAASAASAARPLRLEAELNYRRRSWDPVGELGEAAIDLGPHLVDLALSAAGDAELEPVLATAEPCRFEAELSGPSFSARLRARTDGRWLERIELRDGDGGRLFAACAGGLRAMVPGRSGDPLSGSIAAQLGAWIGGLGGEEAGRGHSRGESSAGGVATAAHGARVMETLEAALAVAAIRPAEIGR